MDKEFIEIPFDAIAPKRWEYTIPEGFEVEIKDGKVLLKEKESEDERIRRGLVYHLKELREWKVGTTSPIKTKGHYDAWITYLEKQKEQAPSTEETELNSIAFLEQLGYTCIPPHSLVGCVDDKKVQKPTKITHDDNGDIELSEFESRLFTVISMFWQSYQLGEEINLAKFVKEHSAELLEFKQKSAEWSEDDLKWAEEIRIALRFYSKDKSFVEKLTNWFDNHIQPKPTEWSEEDDGMLNSIINYLEEVSGRIALPSLKENYTKQVAWLKSLSLKQRLDDMDKLCSNEWSEEDKMHLNNAILAAEKEWGVESCTAKFLKSFRPPLKEEWSEEEAKKAAEDYADEFPGMTHENDGSTIEDYDKPYNDFMAGVLWAKHHGIFQNGNIHWKSSEEQKAEWGEKRRQWKPSEEQMKELELIVNGKALFRTDFIKQLYNDLKKL